MPGGGGAYHRHTGGGRWGESFEALADEPAGEAPSSEQLAAEEQRRRLVAEVLATLSDEDTEVLVPFYVGGMTSAAIAAGTGLDHSTVRGRLMRARARFRAAAGELPEDERSLLEDGVLLVPLRAGSGGRAAMRRGQRGPGRRRRWRRGRSRCWCWAWPWGRGGRIGRGAWWRICRP